MSNFRPTCENPLKLLANSSTFCVIRPLSAVHRPRILPNDIWLQVKHPRLIWAVWNTSSIIPWMVDSDCHNIPQYNGLWLPPTYLESKNYVKHPQISSRVSLLVSLLTCPWHSDASPTTRQQVPLRRPRGQWRSHPVASAAAAATAMQNAGSRRGCRGLVGPRWPGRPSRPKRWGWDLQDRLVDLASQKALENTEVPKNAKSWLESKIVQKVFDWKGSR